MSNLIKEWAFSIGAGTLLISTLMLCSCDAATGSKAVQVPDHWVILDPGDAELVDGRYSWDFELNRIGTYDIQVVTADALPFPAPVARIEVEDQQTGGELTENYVTETVLAGTGHRAAKGFNRDFSPGEFWFTFRKNPAGEKVYAISLARAGESARIRSLNKAAGKIHSVRRLGSDRAVNWEQTTTELVIDTSEWDTGDNGFVVEVSF